MGLFLAHFLHMPLLISLVSALLNCIIQELRLHILFLIQSIKMAKMLGRKRQLIVAALLYVLGGSITAYAPELGVLLAGRLLYGLGIGLVGYFDHVIFFVM